MDSVGTRDGFCRNAKNMFYRIHLLKEMFYFGVVVVAGAVAVAVAVAVDVAVFVVGVVVGVVVVAAAAAVVEHYYF